MQTLETRFEELKRYIGFTAEDAEYLRAARELAAPHFERIAREFYERIRLHEEAHAVFTGEEQIARLHRSLVRWLGRLFSGVYDETYYQDTATIGRVHVKVGLPQRYMFTAMARIRGSLVAIAEASPSDGPGTVAAISRLLDLELAIMLESYRDDFVLRIQQFERLEKQALGRSLARTEHRYINAVELARVLILGLDADACVRLFNREAERVTGHQRDEVLGRAFVEVLHIDDSGDGRRLREQLDRFAELHRNGFQAHNSGPTDDDEPPLETTMQTRTGRTRVVRWRLTYAPAEGDEVSVFALGIDSTDETALLARTQQQEKLAAIGTLAAGLAHEIRNPLNGAQLHLTYLQRALGRGDTGPRVHESVTVVGDEMKRLGALVTEFLEFARPRPLKLETVCVQALLERVTRLVAAQAEGSAVSLSLDVPLTPIELVADHAKLEQVLLNLACNAIEALAPVGGGKVVVRARRQPRTVTLEVEDDGPGIAPGSPIFDAFYSSKPQGTGLGLSITHRIVTDHGGTIDVDSVPGRSLFRVALPLAPVAAPRGKR
ncbi:protoglobin domain-containing protein [Nannocystis radixulma]|uniref:histidine kinase n=1 Tax=Nannocystis radixulma TaxID=2995305 RepID=A0ABT5B6H4_9BACT|nr:protoglobin domain-containing protein [Nannocystis radixulma]MDC0669068.1 protoglobin domain-containing protein [Nannocystis radixulma]